MKMYALIAILLLTACSSNYYECPCNTADSRLKAYHDIITELVEQRFYNYYLGEDEERLFQLVCKDYEDTTVIQRETIRLQNKLFKDTARFATLYIDSLRRPYFDSLSYYLKDTMAFSHTLIKLFGTYADDKQQVIDSLNYSRMPYKSGDFSFCTFRVKSIADTAYKPVAIIGKLSLSGIVFNKTGDKGLIYYEFHCGWLCGKGGLLKIKKDHDKWKIEQDITTWVS